MLIFFPVHWFENSSENSINDQGYVNVVIGIISGTTGQRGDKSPLVLLDVILHKCRYHHAEVDFFPPKVQTDVLECDTKDFEITHKKSPIRSAGVHLMGALIISPRWRRRL